MNKFILVRIAIITALITQVSHAAFVFKSISKTNGWVDEIIAYVFAVSLELSIYIFTIEQKRNVATFFAIISFLINLLYYWNFSQFDFAFYASLLISFTIPTTIWNYSDLINNEPRKRTYVKKTE